MKSIGSTLVVLALMAIVMNFANMVPRVLSWIYAWGDTTAWIIKIITLIVGAILYFTGSDPEEEVLEG